jgi:hypothetical protein
VEASTSIFKKISVGQSTTSTKSSDVAAETLSNCVLCRLLFQGRYKVDSIMATRIPNNLEQLHNRLYFRWLGMYTVE